MVGQIQLLNYFVAVAHQMLNLPRKEPHCDFTSNNHVKKLHFCYISKGCTMFYKPFWIHQYLYFQKMYKKIVGRQQNVSAKAWNNIQSASFKISKMVKVTLRTFAFLEYIQKRGCLFDMKQTVLLPVFIYFCFVANFFLNMLLRSYEYVTLYHSLQDKQLKLKDYEN